MFPTAELKKKVVAAFAVEFLCKILLALTLKEAYNAERAGRKALRRTAHAGEPVE